MTDLQTLADEMKATADQNRISKQRIMEGYVFPDILRQRIELGEVRYILQFSYDELSDQKEMGHLSFSRLDMQEPSDLEVLTFQEAFFGHEKVVQFPGVIGRHVIHLGKITAKT